MTGREHTGTPVVINIMHHNCKKCMLITGYPSIQQETELTKWFQVPCILLIGIDMDRNMKQMPNFSR